MEHLAMGMRQNREYDAHPLTVTSRNFYVGCRRSPRSFLDTCPLPKTVTASSVLPTTVFHLLFRREHVRFRHCDHSTRAWWFVSLHRKRTKTLPKRVRGFLTFHLAVRFLFFCTVTQNPDRTGSRWVIVR
jgi:hypothetical protein